MKKPVIKTIATALMILAAIVLWAGCGGGSPDSGCGSGQCRGNDGNCYGPCAVGYCTTSPSGTCSPPRGGVYCCEGGSWGNCGVGYCYVQSADVCCPNYARYYSGRQCFSNFQDCLNDGNGFCWEC